MRAAAIRCRWLGLSWGLFLGLALSCMSLHGPVAQSDPPKELPPRVASLLRWLPEDTETLFVARSVTVTVPDEAPDWQDVGVSLASQALVPDRENWFRRFGLRLIPSLKDANEIPTGRKGMIIVAAVNNVLHFRIFDWDGKWLVDTDETRLPELARPIDDLRKQLAGLWAPHGLLTREEGPIISAVTSIVDQAQLKPLRGRKIEWIVHGARNFEGVSKFGSLRSESCTTAVFESDLGAAAREWTESLRKGAISLRTLVGREVFVYPSSTVMDRFARETRWQGDYYVLLRPDTLLCASSDRYLEAVLRRVDGPPGTRALPDDLPEWRHVEFDAPVWMLRHVPKPGERAHIIGATAAFTKHRFRVVYLPKTGSEVDANSLKSEWLPTYFPISAPRDPLEIVRRSDGTVVLSCGVKPGDNTLWFLGQLYRLQAFELFQDNR